MICPEVRQIKSKPEPRKLDISSEFFSWLHSSLCVFPPQQSLSFQFCFLYNLLIPQDVVPGYLPPVLQLPCISWLSFHLKSFCAQSAEGSHEPNPLHKSSVACCPVQAALPVTSIVVLSQAHHSPTLGLFSCVLLYQIGGYLERASMPDTPLLSHTYQWRNFIDNVWMVGDCWCIILQYCL